MGDEKNSTATGLRCVIGGEAGTSGAEARDFRWFVGTTISRAIPEAVLLRHSGDGERLARETR